MSAIRLPICFAAALLLHGLATLSLGAHGVRPELARHLPPPTAPFEPIRASVVPLERMVAVESPPLPARAGSQAELPPPTKPTRSRAHRRPAPGAPSALPADLPPPVPAPSLAASAAVAVTATSATPPRTADSRLDDPAPDKPPIDLKGAMLSATKHNQVPSSVMASFGSMEMLLKERSLHRALTWVFPKVVSHDKSYWRWPMGDLGTIDFTVTLGENGRILGTSYGDAGSDAAGQRIQGLVGRARLKGLVEQMIRFLAAGRFSRGTGNEGTAGGTVERRFSLTVRHRAIASDGEARATEHEGDLATIGFDAPVPGRPGRGYIGATNGQEFEATLAERGVR